MSSRLLYLGQPTATAAAVYTSTNAYTTITAATVCNPTAGAVTFSLWTDSAVDGTAVYKNLSVAAGASVGLQNIVAQTLDKGEGLWLEASAATSLTFRISGNQHT